MNTKQINVLNAIKETLRKLLPSGAQAFLYGSRARGDAREGPIGMC